MRYPKRNILVNASAAKGGGAVTVVECFLEWIRDNDSTNRYVFLVGTVPKIHPCNVKLVVVQTSGLGTFAFAICGIWKYCWRGQYDLIIGMGGIVPFFVNCRRIVYVQNQLLLTSSAARSRVFRALAKVQRGVKYVVQSKHIERYLRSIVQFADIQVHWPGVSALHGGVDSNVEDKVNSFVKQGMKLIFFPSASVHSEHKNFKLILENSKGILESRAVVLVPSSNGVDGSGVCYLGQLKRDELAWIYDKVDLILVTSIQETVCLPIFEAASRGRRSMVLDAEYIRAHLIRFPLLNKYVSTFTRQTFRTTLDHLLESKCSSLEPCTSLMKGDWFALVSA